MNHWDATARFSRELAQLYRMALDMGGSSNSKQLGRGRASLGWPPGTSADIGRAASACRTRLSRARNRGIGVGCVQVERRHGNLSKGFGISVDDGTAKAAKRFWARDVADDSLLVNRDGLGEIHAKSVIYAP